MLRNELRRYVPRNFETTESFVLLDRSLKVAKTQVLTTKKVVPMHAVCMGAATSKRIAKARKQRFASPVSSATGGLQADTTLCRRLLVL